MLVSQIFEAYIACLREERSQTTFHTYTSNLRAFLRWLGPDAVVADLSTVTIRKFITDCVGKKQRPRTVRTKLYAIRSLCKYLVAEGHFSTNLARDVEAPRLDAPQRDVATTQEVIDLISACDRIADEYRALLSRAIVNTLAHSGLRRAELLNLYLTDLNLSDGSILVRAGKGNKSGRVFPNEQCLGALREYLKVRPKDCKHPYLFALDRSRRIGTVSLRKMLEELCAIAGHRGNKGLLPHGLRHNYATRLYREGANLEDVKTALRHEHITTTAIYLHADEIRMKEIARFSDLPIPTAHLELPTSPPAPSDQRSGLPTAPPAPVEKDSAPTFARDIATPSQDKRSLRRSIRLRH